MVANSNIKTHEHSGFTIIELMIATIVFSLVLVAASAAIIQIGKKYYRGITYARTQEVTRSTIDEISQSLQFTGQSVKAPNYPDIDGTSGPDTTFGPIVPVDSTVNSFYFCLGAKRYSFAVDRKVTPSPKPNTKEKKHALWVDQPVLGCANAVNMAPAALDQDNPSDTVQFSGTNGRELLDKNMRITKLSIVPRTSGLWSISLAVAAGDDDQLTLLEIDGVRKIVCEGSTFSSEFCATSDISVNVTKRIQ